VDDSVTATATPPPPDLLPQSEPRKGGWPRVLKAIPVALVVGVLLLFGWTVLVPSRGGTLVREIADGHRPPAPSFTLPIAWPRSDTWPPAAATRVSRGRLSLDALRGYPVVLNFWASWCIPCRQEAPLLAREARVYSGKVLFLGVDTQDLRDSARSFAGKNGMDYLSVSDVSDNAYRAYGLSGVPETYFLSRSGHIVAHVPGPVVLRDLEAGIRTARTAP